MSDEIKISEMPAVTVPALTDTVNVVQAGVSKKETISQILSLNPNAYSYVVGDMTKGANYPATLTGLQNALTAANGANPVFVQEPGVPNPGGDGTLIVMPHGTIILGAYNEMPADALTIEDGSFTSNQDPSSSASGACTIIDANLVAASGSGHYSFQNICLSPNSWDGLVVPEGNTIVIYQIKNSWICSAAGLPVINSGGRTTGNGVLYVYSSNSLINNRDGSRLIELQTSGGSAQLNLSLADNSVFYSDNANSDIAGPNVNYFLRVDSGSSYIDSMQFDINASGCNFNWSFLNGFIGNANGNSFLTDNTGDLIPTLSMQNTSFMADAAGGSGQIFQGISGITLQYAGSGSYSQNITVENFTAFCDDPGINSQILEACSGLTINGTTITPIGSFSIINTNPSPSDLYTASIQASVGGLVFPMGTPIKNTTGVNLILIVGFVVTAATGATIVAGTGQSATPTTDTVVPSFSVPGMFTLSIPWPSNHYMSINTTGTITTTNNFIACSE